MAMAQDDHTNAQKNLLLQTLGVVADAVGKLFTPAMKEALKEARLWVNEVLDPWIKRNPRLVKDVTSLTVALGGLTVAVGLLSRAAGLLGMTVWLNPLTWKILAIGAVIASVVYVVYKLYDDWKAAWDKWGDYLIGIAAGVAFVFNPVLGLLIAGAGYVINHWSELKAFFINLFADIGAYIESTWNKISDGISHAISHPAETAQKVWAAFLSWLDGQTGGVLGRGDAGHGDNGRLDQRRAGKTSRDQNPGGDRSQDQKRAERGGQASGRSG
jgi:phage-related protein